MFSRVRQAIKAFQERHFVIIFSETENEADLCIPASEITAAGILFMARVASGLICLALPKSRCEQLEIEPLRSRYQPQDTPFFMPVDSAETGSGVSPKDRATTIKRIIGPDCRPEHLRRPGHVMLLGAHTDGLIGRNGHTEAVVELAELAGLYPGGILCEIIGSDGDMATAQELKRLAKRLRIPLISINTLAEFARSLLPHSSKEARLDKEIKKG